MAAGARTPPLTRAVLIGVTGRMGRAMLRAAPGFPQLLITGAIASPASLALGRDAGEVAGLGATNLIVSGDLPRALAQADVAIDFSHAAATGETLAACRAAGRPLLIGTTGYAPELEAQLNQAAREIALLVTANTSVGVAVLMELTRRAAQALPRTFDVDILDLHHRTKPDAPSGTALALGRAAAAARGASFPEESALRAAPVERSQPHRQGEIGFASVRAGDIVGEHTVLFSGVGEELTLTHRASDRAIFARGALAAALWLAPQPPGRYDMMDFLGFKTAT
jgi:4-hydroxy-tetrahydrodipicolinate reductase